MRSGGTGPAYWASASSAARPSVAGVCAITAAMRASSAATATTWPPEYEVPQSTMRSESTPSSLRAWAMAAR